MRKTLALGSTLFLLSAHAHAASIVGTWKGAGKLFDNKGVVVNCESMVVSVAQAGSNLTVSTSFTCNGESASAPGGTLLVKGSDLWENGAKVGTITPTSVTILVKDAEHSDATSCIFNDKEMSFHTVVSYANDPGHVITFDGKLTR